MLNRLQLFRNVGQFDLVAAAATITLGRMTLVYAENGRGKTTLSAILRSLATGDPLPIAERRRLGAADPPHIVIDCGGGPPPAMFQNNVWNRTVPNMTIFDDTFIDENICSGLVVDPDHRQRLHDLILGAQGVTLSRALQQIVDQIEERNRSLRMKGDAIPASARGTISVEDFCALQARADIDEAIQEAERNLAAAQEQQNIRTTGNFDPIILPSIDLPPLNALLARELTALDAAAADQVQRHFAGLGASAEAWVASGMDLIPGGAAQVRGKPCPFCARDLGGSPIIAHYRAYFSAEYAGLKRDVADAIDEVSRQHAGDAPAAFERSVRGAAERRQFWSRFTAVPEVSIDTTVIAGARAAARNAVTAVLRAKQGAPLEDVRLSATDLAAIAKYNRLRHGIIELTARLHQANAAIALVKEQAAAGNTTALAADVARLRAVKVRHTPAVARLELGWKTVPVTRVDLNEEIRSSLPRTPSARIFCRLK